MGRARWQVLVEQPPSDSNGAGADAAAPRQPSRWSKQRMVRPHGPAQRSSCCAARAVPRGADEATDSAACATDTEFLGRRDGEVRQRRQRLAAATLAAACSVLLAGAAMTRFSSHPTVRNALEHQQSKTTIHTQYTSPITYSPQAYNKGCVEWEGIKIGEKTQEGNLASCAKRCSDHNEGRRTCRSFSYQPQDDSCDSGGADQLKMSRGDCMIYRDYCTPTQQLNQCLDLYVLDFPQAGTNVQIQIQPTQSALHFHMTVNSIDYSQLIASHPTVQAKMIKKYKEFWLNHLKEQNPQQYANLVLDDFTLELKAGSVKMQTKISVVPGASTAQLQGLQNDVTAKGGKTASAFADDLNNDYDFQIISNGKITVSEPAGFQMEGNVDPQTPVPTVEPTKAPTRAPTAAPTKSLEQMLDTNANSEVTKQEAAGAPEVGARFPDLDTNGDQVLSDSELKDFQTLDSNSDDLISKAEAAEDNYVKERFDAWDTSNDGSLTQEELAAVKDSTSKPTAAPTSAPTLATPAPTSAPVATAATTAAPPTPPPTPFGGGMGTASASDAGDPDSVETSLKYDVVAGQKEIYGEDESRFSEGDTVSIADASNSETHVVVSVGSMVLDSPLQNSFSKGARIHKIPAQGTSWTSVFAMVVLLVVLPVLFVAGFAYMYVTGKWPKAAAALQQPGKARELSTKTFREDAIARLFRTFNVSGTGVMSSEELLNFTRSMSDPFERSRQDWDDIYDQVVGRNTVLNLDVFRNLVSLEGVFYQTDEELNLMVAAGVDSTNISSANDRQSVSTTIMEAVRQRSTTLPVRSQAGFFVGQTIEISGGGKSETNTVAGFGSILLAWPLQHSYPGGSTVRAVEDIGDCESAVRTIFERFDRDRDGMLNHVELLSFARHLPHEPFDGTEDDWVGLYNEVEATIGPVSLPVFRQLVNGVQQSFPFYLQDEEVRNMADEAMAHMQARDVQEVHHPPAVRSVDDAPQFGSGSSAQANTRQSWIRALFELFDRDADGVLNREELMTFAQCLPDEPFDGTREDWDVTYRQIMQEHGPVDFPQFELLTRASTSAAEEDAMLSLADDQLRTMLETQVQRREAANSSGALEARGRQHMVSDLFRALDANRDGQLDSEELRALALLLVRLRGMDVDWSQEWQQICPHGASAISIHHFEALIDASGPRHRWSIENAELEQLLVMIMLPQRKTFRLTFKRQKGVPIGITLSPKDPSTQDKELQVLHIFHGTLSCNYNLQMQDPERRIRRCDFVTMVNGKIGNGLAMKQEIMHEGNELVMEFARDPVIEVGEAAEDGSCDVCGRSVRPGDRIAVGENDFWIRSQCIDEWGIQTTRKENLPKVPERNSKLLVEVIRAQQLPEVSEKGQGKALPPNAFVEIKAKLRGTANWRRLTAGKSSSSAAKGKWEPSPSQTSLVPSSQSPDWREIFELVDPEWDRSEHDFMGVGPLVFEVKALHEKTKSVSTIGVCTLHPENFAPSCRTEPVVVLPLEVVGGESKRSFLMVKAEWTPKA